MSSSDDPVKKIVSKGKYVRVLLKRAVILMAGCTAVVLAVICLLAVASVLAPFVQAVNPFVTHPLLLVLFFVIFAGMAGAVILALGEAGFKLVKHSAKMNNVVPLTRTTLSELPAQESLVRASEEPPILPATVLLRAAAENSITPSEQLVRPSSTPTQT